MQLRRLGEKLDEYRSVIIYLNFKGATHIYIYTDMVATSGDIITSFPTVKRWVAGFKKGRKNVDDEPRWGHPSTASTQENIDRMHQMIIFVRRLTIRSIAMAIRISNRRAENIFS